MNSNSPTLRPDFAYEGFLKCQYESGLRLSNRCDVLELTPLARRGENHIDPLEGEFDATGYPNRYIAHFDGVGLVRNRETDVISESTGYRVGIRFPHDYLERASTFEVMSWLGPADAWHPNICDRAQLICLGRMSPGTELVDILYQVYEIVTYQKVTMKENDALNHAACVWARAHQERFPVDSRPLTQSMSQVEFVEIERSS